MTQFDRLRSIDYSPFLVHFTRDTGSSSERPIEGADFVTEEHQLFQHLGTTALEKLLAILSENELKTSPQIDLPNRPEAACFTESVWGSFTRITSAFSSFGIGFNKRFVFDRGGGPALYTRGDIFSDLSNSFPSSLEPFVKPSDPDGSWIGKHSNYLFEREWRIDRNLVFNHVDVEFVIVDTYKDADFLVQSIDSPQITASKIIVMESHRLVREYWGGAL